MLVKLNHLFQFLKWLQLIFIELFLHTEESVYIISFIPKKRVLWGNYYQHLEARGIKYDAQSHVTSEQ